MVIASIPSPSSELIELGPLELRYYGLCIALGVLAAVWLASRRNVARGGHPDDISSIAMWAVPAGLVGARLYHVITDWRSFEGRWGDAYKIWEGGLGIPGGMALGIAVGIWAARRRGLTVRGAVDICAPALPLAQAIGRWGNWFNQELYGRPSDAPWALEIDPDVVARHTPEYIGETTFHPTFLYESLWNFALVGFLLWIDRRKVLKPGRLIWVYVLGYGVGRLWVELLRIDTASRIFGVRVNVWVSLVAIAASLLILSRSKAQPGDRGSEGPRNADDPDRDDAEAADVSAD
ncbi:MAG: prolipoprotein diacylglyceryl transferase [Acidimicrobiales bacterium]|nr:prolipoprotein diacylglyceryl transferase [Acidimicrobiales bacterium]